MNRSKQKGTWFETLIVRYLQNKGLPARRNPPAGSKDIGDIGGLPFVLEVKNWVRLDLAGWIDEAEREAQNAGQEWYAVVHKRKGRGGAAHQYVTLPLGVFVEMIK